MLQLVHLVKEVFLIRFVAFGTRIVTRAELVPGLWLIPKTTVMDDETLR